MIWVNMALAYERLPEPVKAQIAGLHARHSIEATFGAAMPVEKRLALKAQYPDAEHPVVRTHPETGEKVLFVNAFTTHFTNFHTPENVRFGGDTIMAVRRRGIRHVIEELEIGRGYARLGGGKKRIARLRQAHRPSRPRCFGGRVELSSFLAVGTERFAPRAIHLRGKVGRPPPREGGLGGALPT